MTDTPDPAQVNSDDVDTDRTVDDASAPQVPDSAPDTEAERPGSEKPAGMSEDELVDHWGEESFPGSDAPAHY
ncbi:hypothetical protein DFO66_10431 [Brevibacterium sanguinis]|uniref:Uncharacterized protein n=2 Tax=Brevibacterium TaxID=1696 RepID=A0A366ILD9_9MICO|nr:MULTISPECIES: hypothetical protein [Brevibacterium]RBP65448.1 hypothetical protein DFO66_10431 [Brevibacterium sanguinis]RBP72082.1 hypothetical protein DFO65_10437 [Brevibacterium celere]